MSEQTQPPDTLRIKLTEFQVEPEAMSRALKKGDFEGKLNQHLISQFTARPKYVRNENGESTLTSSGTALCQAINKAVNSQVGLVILRHDIYELWNKRPSGKDTQVFEDFASGRDTLGTLSYEMVSTMRWELGDPGSSLDSLNTKTCPLTQLLSLAITDCISIDNDPGIANLKSVKTLTDRINTIRELAGNNPITPQELVQDLGLKHKLAD